MTHILAELNASLIGRYLVEKEVGQGGMATVYLARDVRHERKVAIKVLHPDLAAVIGAERFVREIRTMATLQHPHILGLIDSGKVTGTAYYVMPFVDGESLRDRLSREKQLPIADAVRVASEVADALQYAHDHKIIHRDIKPENILLQGGHALVADFGIALAASKAGTRMTETGMSLGTPQYMSPEQAMGERDLDARSDIYALGCVTYEMLTGEPPFTGPTAQAIVAKVMTMQPAAATSLRSAVPRHVAEAVHVALQKLPADRFTAVKDFSEALHAPHAATSRMFTAAIPAHHRPGQRARLLAGAAVIALAGGMLGWRVHRPPAATSTPMRFSITAEPGYAISDPTISRDGTMIVYTVADSSGTSLYERRISELSGHRIEGTQNGDYAMFSPDGRSIAFVADDELKRIGLDGEGPTVIAPLSGGAFYGASWAPDNRIYFATYPEARLRAVSADGGTPALVKVSDTTISAWGPVPVPGRDALVFDGGGKTGVLDLASGKIRILLSNAFGPVMASSSTLLFTDATGVLFRQQFDPQRLDTIGPRVPIGEQGVDWFYASGNGVLVLSAHLNDLARLELIDRAGTAKLLITDQNIWAPRFSPDGQRIAYGRYLAGQQAADLWIATIGDGARSRVTSTARDNNDVTWSPDGKFLAFSAYSERGSASRKHLYIQSLGTGVAHPIVTMPGEQWTSDWSRDGRFILFTNSNENHQEIWFFSRVDSTVHPYLQGPSQETAGRFSPDGKWVAYASDEGGQWQVYVQAFPGLGEKVVVSNDGGTHPAWRGDGREIYYWRNGQLWAAELSATEPLTVTARRPLFRANYSTLSPQANYDVRADGTLFVVRTKVPSNRIDVTIGALP